MSCFQRGHATTATHTYCTCSATCVKLGHRAIAAGCLYAAAFKPNSWARKLWVAPAAKMPLRLNPDGHLRHSTDMRNGRRNWMLKILVVSSGWAFRNGKTRAGVASVAVASLKDHRPPWDLPACPSFAGCTGTNARSFDVSTPCINALLG